MLVLTRRPGESITVDGGIRITVVEVQGKKTRIAIEAPDAVKIYRSELVEPGAVTPAEAPCRCSVGR